MSVERKPNLFIIGAPKCGTTALYSYLKTHPDICFSSMKEPRYFDTDQGKKNKKIYFGANHNIKRYLELFQNATNESIIAEASPSYLASKVAISNILKFNPYAKFIIMIRNPIKQIQSLNIHKQYTSGELKPLEEIFTPENPGSITKTFQHYCSTGSQLEYAIQQIPSSQLHVILFDDFCADTPGTYKEVLSFLELPDDGRTDFTPANEAKLLRSSTVERTLHFYNKKLQKYVVRTKQILGIGRLGIADKIQQINSKPAKKPTLSENFIAELESIFVPEIRKIEQLTNRDLSHWYKLTDN